MAAVANNRDATRCCLRRRMGRRSEDNSKRPALALVLRGRALVGGIGIALWVVTLVAWVLARLGILATSSSLPAGELLRADGHILGLRPSHWVDWFPVAAGLGLDYRLGPHYYA